MALPDAIKATSEPTRLALPVVNPDGSLVGSTAPGGTENVAVVSQIGAANLANNQVTVANTATTIVAARATRRSVTIVNLGVTPVYIGIATVTTANGFLLPGVVGAAITVDFVGLVQGIVGSGTQAVAYIEEYD